MGLAFFSLFRQFTSPTDPLNLKFSQSFPNNNNLILSASQDISECHVLPLTISDHFGIEANLHLQVSRSVSPQAVERVRAQRNTRSVNLCEFRRDVSSAGLDDFTKTRMWTPCERRGTPSSWLSWTSMHPSAMYPPTANPIRPGPTESSTSSTNVKTSYTDGGYAIRETRIFTYSSSKHAQAPATESATISSERNVPRPVRTRVSSGTS